MILNSEKDVLKFWEDNKIYDKSRKKNAKGKKFFMMDGPPYATGHIHLGTALNKTLKDVAMRSRRMQGYDIFDRPLYDTHGVPIELQVEKEIGSKGKQDIEKFGVQNFVDKCKDFATQHIDTMNSEFKDLGVWMDWDNTYFTFNDEYIEAIWAAFKEADKKGLLYLGKYPVHVCTRCQTAVAFNEIEYVKQKDTSVYVKFKVKDKDNTYLIIFTTTPWTLPANTGIMANPSATYQEITTSEGEKWIIAKDLVAPLMVKTERGFTPGKEFKGKDMKGWKYESPLAKFIKLKTKKAYEVVLSAKYVNTEDGTGLVHCAPGHGKEDFEVGRENGLDILCPVDISGALTEETGKYSGKMARIVDKEIIEDLEKEGALVFKEQYEHDYPVCWRDKTPLLMLARPQWFLKVSKIKKDLLKQNEKNNWMPDWAKLRMKAWLEGISDWPVSRQRYWGAPLPIWFDPETEERIVVGSMEELRKLSGVKKLDMHKPGIDNITIKKGKKVLKRVPEVLDVWFDSGVSSWAILGYPQNKTNTKKYWPADFNVEGTDQFRGWWNSQMILSQILFDKKPFDNVMVHGMILDISKKKMSKSLGNFTAPSDVINKFSRDFLRYYLAKFSKGLDFSYDEKEFENAKKLVNMLSNTENFLSQISEGKKKIEIEDKWILSKYHNLVKKVIESYNRYDFPTAITLIEDFAINDLSRRYIKLVRERSDETKELLGEILIGLHQLLSPIMPFGSEMAWQRMKEKKMVKEESITLAGFPLVEKKMIDEKLEKEFDSVIRVIENGLSERDKAKIGLRWPLASIQVSSKDKIDKKFDDIIMSQLNVKKVKHVKGTELKVEFDLKITPALEAEGFARELARKIQAERKVKGMKKGEMVEIKLYTSEKLSKAIRPHLSFIKERTNSSKLTVSDDKNGKGEILFTVKEENISISFL